TMDESCKEFENIEFDSNCDHHPSILFYLDHKYNVINDIEENMKIDTLDYYIDTFIRQSEIQSTIKFHYKPLSYDKIDSIKGCLVLLKDTNDILFLINNECYGIGCYKSHGHGNECYTVDGLDFCNYVGSIRKVIPYEEDYHIFREIK